MSTISGSISRAANVTTAAATVTHTTASRQPHIRLKAAVSGLPTTSARLVPTYIDMVARPAWLGGTSRVAIGAMTAHSRPWVIAQSTRPAARTAKLGASAEITCEAVRQVRLSMSARRRGQCAVQRTSGNVVRAATKAYQVNSVPTANKLTCRSRAMAGSAPTGRISAVT